MEMNKILWKNSTHSLLALRILLFRGVGFTLEDCVTSWGQAHSFSLPSFRLCWCNQRCHSNPFYSREHHFGLAFHHSRVKWVHWKDHCKWLTNARKTAISGNTSVFCVLWLVSMIYTCAGFLELLVEWKLKTIALKCQTNDSFKFCLVYEMKSQLQYCFKFAL